MTINGISGGWGGTGIEQTQASAERSRFRAVHDAASNYLGLSAEELRGELANGQSLAQVAEANGKSVDGLTQAIADAITKTDGSANATSIAERIVSASPGAPPTGGFPPSGDGFGAQLAQVTRGFGVNSGASGLDEIRTAVNDFLGLTDDEVRSQLAQGQTLGGIAEANGKTADDLEQAIAKAIANADPSADAAGIAHTIVSTQPGSGISLENGIGGTDLGQQLHGYAATGVDGYSAGLVAPAAGLGGSTLEQLLLEKLATATGGAFRGIDEFA